MSFRALVLLLALSVPTALAQTEPDPARVALDENEPYYPSYVRVVPLCEGGSSSFEPRGMTVSEEGGDRRIVIDRPHEGWSESVGFRHDSVHALSRFTMGGSSVLVRFEGVFEFVDADGSGSYDAGEDVLREYLVADDADALRELPPAGEPAAPESGAHPEPVEPHSASPPSYLLHMARDWRSPCGIQMRWTYFLELGPDEFSRKLGARDPAVFDDEPRLALAFTHVGQPYDLDGTPRAPERAKIDIEVHDFPFTSDESMLGVRAWVLGFGAPLEVDGGTIRAADGSGFAWAADARADGRDIPVGASMADIAVPDWALPSWTEGATSAAEVVLAYPRAVDLVHDPELGVLVATHDAPTHARETPLPGVLLALAALGLAARTPLK